MNKAQFQKVADKHYPKKPKLRNAIVAFLSGGMMAIIGQTVLNTILHFTDYDVKEALPFVSISFIIATVILTGFGVYDKLGQIFGAGLFIPISGFANSMASSAIEAKSEGLVYGIGGNLFKLAGTVIVYGVVTTYILGIIRFLLSLGGINL
jgi:stage V sporulation protein AC